MSQLATTVFNLRVGGEIGAIAFNRLGKISLHIGQTIAEIFMLSAKYVGHLLSMTARSHRNDYWRTAEKIQHEWNRPDFESWSQHVHENMKFTNRSFSSKLAETDE